MNVPVVLSSVVDSTVLIPMAVTNAYAQQDFLQWQMEQVVKVLFRSYA